MPTKKQPRQPLITTEVLPVVTDAGSTEFRSAGRTYALTMTLSVSTDPETAERWARPILWKHTVSDLDAHRYDGPQRVTGWFCPATFVLRGTGSLIEFTLDLPDAWRRTIDGRPLALDQGRGPLPDPIPEIVEVRNRNRPDGIRSPIEFPSSFPDLKAVTSRALRLALVIANAIAPGKDNDSGSWRYEITDYCHGQLEDVPMTSRAHRFPAKSDEGLTEVLELFDESKRNNKKQGEKAWDEYVRIARIIGRSPHTVKDQVNELYRRGWLPRKDQR